MHHIRKPGSRATAAIAVAALAFTTFGATSAASTPTPNNSTLAAVVTPAPAPEARAAALGDKTVSYVGSVQVVSSSADALPAEMKTAIERDLGMSPQKYLDQSAISTAASRTLAELEKQFPGQLAGAWAKDGQIHVAATTPAALAAIKALGVNAVAAKRSTEALSEIGTKLLQLPGEAVVSVGQNPITGGLVVGLAPGKTLPVGVVPADVPVTIDKAPATTPYADVAPDWTGTHGLQGGRAIFLAKPIAGLTTDPNQWRPYAKYPVAGDPGEVYDAWNAAVRYYNSEVVPKLNEQGFGRCTIGFNMKADGTVNSDTRSYISTSGHCFAAGDQDLNVWVDNDSDVPTFSTRQYTYTTQTKEAVVIEGSVGKFIGNPTLYQVGGGTTTAGAPVAGNAYIGNWPGAPNMDAALVPIGADSGLAPTNRVWTYPGTKASNPAESVSVTAVGNPSVGDNICHSGGTTGWHCGPVTSTTNQVRSLGGQSGVINVLQATMCAGPGDSGGATVMGTTAVGLLQGGSDGTAFIAGTPDCNPDKVHTSSVSDMKTIKPALDALGIRVLQDVAPPAILAPVSGATLTAGTTTVTVRGTAVAGDNVEVHVDGVLVGTVKADAITGAWSVANVAVTPGAHTVKAQSKRDGVNFSDAVTSAFTVAAPVVTPTPTPTTSSPTPTVTTTSPSPTPTVTTTSPTPTPTVTTTSPTPTPTVTTTSPTPTPTTTTTAPTTRPTAKPTTKPTTKPKPALVVYKTPTSDALYKLTGSGSSLRAVYVSFAEWSGAGYPAPRAMPVAYVKYAWSDDIYAVAFWGTERATWTWQKLTFADWQRVGFPRFNIAGWILGTSVHKYVTSDELFAVLNGKVHKLSFAEWSAMGFLPFTTRADAGFVKAPGADAIYKMSSLSRNVGQRVTFAQWVAESFPTPRVTSTVPR